MGGLGVCSGGLGFGGSRGIFNLTPAQHYHLKAKYAAATGGPPPTPLPNMVSLKTRAAMMNECSSNPLPPLVRPQRCNDANGHMGYRRRVLYPGEGPINGNRRASDPVRTQAHDACNLPPVQRFNSLNNLHPLPSLSHHSVSETRSFSLQNYTRPEGSLQHSQYTPSIAEQAALEALAMEDNSEAGVLLGDEDMLPDDLVQYLHSQVHAEGDYMQLDQIALGQRDNYQPLKETPDGNTGFSGSQQQVTVRRSPSKLPIQWNEVSSGSADISPQTALNLNCERWSGMEHRPVSVPFGRFSNMVVQQQMSLDLHKPSAQASASQTACSVNQAVKSESSPYSCMEVKGTAHISTYGKFSQIPNGLHPTFKQQTFNGPQKQSHLQQNHNYSTSCHVGNNLVLNRTIDNLPGLSQSTGLHPNKLTHIPRPPANGYRNHSVRTQQYLNPERSGELQIQHCLNQQRGINNCPIAHQGSVVKLEAPDDGYLEEGFINLSFEPVEPKPSLFPVLEDQCLLESMAESVGQDGGSASAPLLSPGMDQVTSTVDASVAGVLNEGVSLDFGVMMEDSYDQGSLVSGVLSPSMFQGLSRTSSRLTTPHGSAAFHSVAPGLNNMAIGDMSSLLTTLAEESKFLAIMQ